MDDPTTAVTAVVNIRATSAVACWTTTQSRREGKSSCELSLGMPFERVIYCNSLVVLMRLFIMMCYDFFSLRCDLSMRSFRRKLIIHHRVFVIISRNRGGKVDRGDGGRDIEKWGEVRDEIDR